MRLLGVHSDGFGYGVKEQATASAYTLSAEQRQFKIDSECLVVFTAIEDGDTTALTSRVTTDITDRTRQLGAKDIIVYPYVHLTDAPAPFKTAKDVLDSIAEGFEPELNVIRAPFGWYKGFELECLGHPLPEWGARYYNTDAEEATSRDRQGSEFTRFVVVDAEGKTEEVDAQNFKNSPTLFRNKLLF